jgi:hypothetical protein
MLSQVHKRHEPDIRALQFDLAEMSLRDIASSGQCALRDTECQPGLPHIVGDGLLQRRV